MADNNYKPVEAFFPFLSEFHPDFNETSLRSFLFEHLAGDQQTAEHGSSISGRPGTQIILTDAYVIKIHGELHIAMVDCYDYIHDSITKETKLGIYHPNKIWFYLLLDNNQTLIGNITPRLTSLDNLKTENEEGMYQQICKTIALYFRSLVEINVRLDMSLSNFAVDSNRSQLYYLDDETYDQDDFAQLTDYLSFLIRSDTISNEAIIRKLGRYVYKQLALYYPDKHFNIPIIQTLKNSFFAPDKQYALQTLTSALYDTSEVQLKTANTHRMAVIADIHANAPALKAVLKFLKQNNIEDILVLGDIVGYGPHPNECVELLRHQEGLQVICGNHDYAAYTKDENKNAGITSHAGWALSWTREKISPESAKWLAQLPLYIDDSNWLAVHGAPIDEHYFNAYVYQMSYSSNLDALTQRDIPICFHGHTHIQKIYYRYKGEDFESSKELISIAEHQHSLICPGSVGQPRCGTPGAELAIVDFSDHTVHFHRLEYDIKQTMRDMRAAGFPAVLIERLEQGH